MERNECVSHNRLIWPLRYLNNNILELREPVGHPVFVTLACPEGALGGGNSGTGI